MRRACPERERGELLAAASAPAESNSSSAANRLDKRASGNRLISDPGPAPGSVLGCDPTSGSALHKAPDGGASIHLPANRLMVRNPPSEPAPSSPVIAA